MKGTVSLAVRRLPAARGPATGTLLFIAGGPGQSATGVFPKLGLIARRLLPIGSKGQRERTVRAARLTIADALLQTLIVPKGRFRRGGLRGGRLDLRGRRLTLARYEYVPGVRVSGRLRIGRVPKGTVAVSGRDVTPARVTINGTRLTVRFKGRKKARQAVVSSSPLQVGPGGRIRGSLELGRPSLYGD